MSFPMQAHVGSSALMRRLYPTTSAAKIAASLLWTRFSVMWCVYSKSNRRARLCGRLTAESIEVQSPLWVNLGSRWQHQKCLLLGAKQT